MSEFPIMPFYVGDYLSDTAHLDTTEHGAYNLLLFHYWKKRRGPENDIKTLAKITKMSPKKWQKVSPAVLEFFEIREGRLWQKRMEKELQSALDKHNRRVKAGQKGGQAKSSNAIAKPKQCSSNGVARARVSDSDSDSDKTLNPPVELDPELDGTDSPENSPIKGNPDLDAAELEGEPDPQDRANWKALFVFWQEQHNHPRALFTKEREAKLRARLREGYSLEDCAAAIRGVKKSKFHMGDNPDGKMWNEWTLIFRSGAYLEKFRDLDLEGVKT